MDVERTRQLAWDVYRYARLFEADTLRLDPTDDNIAGNLSINFLALGLIYQQRGDLERAAANYERSNHLSPNPQVSAIIATIRAATTLPLPGTADSGTAPAGGDSAPREGRRRRDRGGPAGPPRFASRPTSTPGMV
jgi:hypothetical protein